MNKKIYLNALAVCFLLGGFLSLAFAAEKDIYMDVDSEDFVYDDSGDIPWKEDRLNKLVPPNEDNLIEVDIDHPPIGFKVYIDETSIEVSKTDQVVRYWLVLKAGKKGRNAFYEGIHCLDSTYKTYAFENKWKKGKVNVSKVAKWQPIRAEGHQYFRFELKKYFLCSEVLPRPVKDILDLLKGYTSTTAEYDPTYHYVQ